MSAMNPEIQISVFLTFLSIYWSLFVAQALVLPIQ